jgi:hypothetical protein
MTPMSGMPSPLTSPRPFGCAAPVIVRNGLALTSTVAAGAEAGRSAAVSSAIRTESWTLMDRTPSDPTPRRAVRMRRAGTMSA